MTSNGCTYRLTHRLGGKVGHVRASEPRTETLAVISSGSQARARILGWDLCKVARSPAQRFAHVVRPASYYSCMTNQAKQAEPVTKHRYQLLIEQNPGLAEILTAAAKPYRDAEARAQEAPPEPGPPFYSAR